MAKEKLRKMLELQPLCYYCGKEMNQNYGRSNMLQATVDHKFPLSRGGLDIPENKVLACKGCNWSKGPLTEEEFVERVRTGIMPKRAAIQKAALPTSRAGSRKRKEIERIKSNPIKQASMPACLLWDR